MALLRSSSYGGQTSARLWRGEVWWRRRELNPRPKLLAVKRIRAFPASKISADPYRTGKNRIHPARLDLGLQLRTEALSLSCHMTHNPFPYRPGYGGGYLVN